MIIKGIFPPMLTPFKENGDVDYNAFIRNIEKWDNEPLGGYLVLGSNSETAYLNEEEKLTLIELTVQTAKKQRTILAGTGLESTRETIRLTNMAARLGAHAALVLTPNYYSGQMSDEALIKHFTSIADASEIPILIYNVPKFTHFNISVEAVRILSQHPNIIGMKDSAGTIAQLEAFRKATPETFNLIVGSATILYQALTIGVKSGILALANCAPKACAEVQELFSQGKHDEAKQLQERLLPAIKAVTDTYGIAGLKYASTLMGYEGGFVRNPLIELRPNEKENIRTILKQIGIEIDDLRLNH
ncbi:MAG: dihydrodipicolinate synthase family protein [Ignavibacteriae bacterium]|nr:dihydrodipicolinate synthase family protein [Ignavibacteriota bacterium]